jgi:hypothetical protein
MTVTEPKTYFRRGVIDFTLITAQHACILTSLLFIMRELKILYDVKSKYLLGMTITL